MEGYIANKYGIFSENFTGEHVIVNLNLGNYYNVRNLASSVWGLMQQDGIIVTDLVSAIEKNYQVNTTCANDVVAFIDKLEEEQLIIKSEVTNSINLDKVTFPTDYTCPGLEVFNDLQDLFLLDPVHDVDNAMGWPFKPESV